MQTHPLVLIRISFAFERSPYYVAQCQEFCGFATYTADVMCLMMACVVFTALMFFPKGANIILVTTTVLLCTPFARHKVSGYYFSSLKHIPYCVEHAVVSVILDNLMGIQCLSDNVSRMDTKSAGSDFCHARN